MILVAVVAFKVVYAMEVMRRRHDRRIRCLYMEMKDMIAVLIQCVDLSYKGLVVCSDLHDV